MSFIYITQDQYRRVMSEVLDQPIMSEAWYVNIMRAMAISACYDVTSFTLRCVLLQHPYVIHILQSLYSTTECITDDMQSVSISEVMAHWENDLLHTASYSIYVN